MVPLRTGLLGHSEQSAAQALSAMVAPGEDLRQLGKSVPKTHTCTADRSAILHSGEEDATGSLEVVVWLAVKGFVDFVGGRLPPVPP
ncbi:hypothetical protein GCM10017690_14620 [Microbacterium terregens]